ncbi:MAG: hypothetical protein OEZ06_08570 [Myxococcales bacterium]|nr:hypothetical protein [Myxococcales bacterium]
MLWLALLGACVDQGPFAVMIPPGSASVGRPINADSGAAGGSGSGPFSIGSFCGDGSLASAEQCDGEQGLEDLSCASFGLGAGRVTCDPVDCTFDVSGCEVDAGWDNASQCPDDPSTATGLGCDEPGRSCQYGPACGGSTCECVSGGEPGGDQDAGDQDGGVDGQADNHWQCYPRGC